MSRELWAEEKCEHGRTEDHFHKGHLVHDWCREGSRTPFDFDAIWDRYLDLVASRARGRLTKDELRKVVLGGTE